MIDLKHLHHAIGASGRLSFGKPELLAETLGVLPGSVTAFAAMNDDRRPRHGCPRCRHPGGRDRVNGHPMENTATTTIAGPDLVAFLSATGHEPRIVAPFGRPEIEKSRRRSIFTALTEAVRAFPGRGRASGRGTMTEVWSIMNIDLSPAGRRPAPMAAGGADLIKDTTTQAFAGDVLEESRRQPVLVDFWAPWCGPCRTLSPIIEKAVKAAKGAVKLVKMNIDDHPAIPGQLGIQSIPAVIAFNNGQPVDGFVGALPESQVKAFIERVAGPAGPSDAEALVEEGERRLAAKDLAGAAEAFAAALGSRTAVGRRPRRPRRLPRRRRQSRRRPPDARPPFPTTAAGRSQGRRRPRQDRPRRPDRRRSATRPRWRRASPPNPKDHQARFDLALVLNAQGDREGATDRLLEIVTRDRSWEDEKARKQLVQFFEAWGPTDEATLSGRRRLSSALFA